MRKLLCALLALTLLLSVFTLGASAEEAYPNKIIAGVFIRSLTNPYEVELVEGANMFADFFNERGCNIEYTPATAAMKNRSATWKRS